MSERASAGKRSAQAWDAHEYVHDAGVNGCRSCGGSRHWPVHTLAAGADPEPGGGARASPPEPRYDPSVGFGTRNDDTQPASAGADTEPRHHYEFDCGNCGEHITALIPCVRAQGGPSDLPDAQKLAIHIASRFGVAPDERYVPQVTCEIHETVCGPNDHITVGTAPEASEEVGER